MNHIDNFFAKFKSAFVNSTNKKETIAAVCLAKTGAKISPDEIEIQGRVARLKTSPGAKSAIFLKKAAILEEINQKIKPTLVDIC